MFGGGGIHFVFHFKHNGDEFHPVCGLLAENIVSFAAGAGIIILFKIRILKAHSAVAVKLNFTMLFQGFA